MLVFGVLLAECTSVVGKWCGGVAVGGLSFNEHAERVSPAGLTARVEAATEMLDALRRRADDIEVSQNR